MNWETMMSEQYWWILIIFRHSQNADSCWTNRKLQKKSSQTWQKSIRAIQSKNLSNHKHDTEQSNILNMFKLI